MILLAKNMFQAEPKPVWNCGKKIGLHLMAAESASGSSGCQSPDF